MINHIAPAQLTGEQIVLIMDAVANGPDRPLATFYFSATWLHVLVYIVERGIVRWHASSPVDKAEHRELTARYADEHEIAQQIKVLGKLPPSEH